MQLDKNTMSRLKVKVGNKKYDDLDFNWIVDEFGINWKDWREQISIYMLSQKSSVGPKLAALQLFFRNYLAINKDLVKPDSFFCFHHDSDLLHDAVRGDSKKDSVVSLRYNIVLTFIDWFILKNFSELDDFGKPVPQFYNPFKRDDLGPSSNRLSESIYNPLPYSVIKRLRDIVCPNEYGHFKDWRWAHEASRADWFEISEYKVNKSDPDCVTKKIGKRYYLWSPVRAMIIFIKLHIPLRTYQVRMLDSGEGDYWRYASGNWVVNNKWWAAKSERTCFRKSFFRKMNSSDLDENMTGLFISTNKTADKNKDIVDRGYTIPWQHEVILYWAEKLRNWQEKYNPISEPIKFTDLSTNHIGLAKSKYALEQMGETCFLMRHAAARNSKDTKKPIPPRSVNVLWHTLLDTLEKTYEAEGVKSSSGSPLKLVERRLEQGKPPRIETLFPLHSLRVSLLTCFGLEGGVPVPVLSKLIAGHSRVLMTIYYQKVLPDKMRDLLSEAENNISQKSKRDFEIFLENSPLKNIADETHHVDVQSIKSALDKRNPISWERRYYGVCLAAGNNLPASGQQSKNISGCWNGGGLLDDTTTFPVPNGPENCIRCRWFITGAIYIDALRAGFNKASYQASTAIEHAMAIESEVDKLENERVQCARINTIFLKIDELREYEGRLEKQMSIANEYAHDMSAYYSAIARIMEVEKARGDNDDKGKMIAVGTRRDLDVAINIKTDGNELLHLIDLCEDAELYPEIADDLLKTSVIHKRSDYLAMALARDGYTPPFMLMDDHMKLIAGNAMVRAMAKSLSPEDWRGEGYKLVSGMIETGDFLTNNGIIRDGVEALNLVCKSGQDPILVNKIIYGVNNGN